MLDQSTPPPLATKGGAAKARRRIERGLPRYTERTLARRKEYATNNAASQAAHRATREAARPDDAPTKISSRTRARAQYSRRALFVQTLKVERGCTDCGYNAHPVALDFDHIPGTLKVANISRLTTAGSEQALLFEISKCEVVCANCHRIRTFKRREELRAAAR